MTVAALYVETGGCYFGLADVDPWDQARDARAYAGPHPVVAHPPCERWGRFWHGSPRKPHQFDLGDDGAAFGQVLERKGYEPGKVHSLRYFSHAVEACHAAVPERQERPMRADVAKVLAWLADGADPACRPVLAA